ncbi:MAG: Mrp/NBP35 family ATP-binding protein [Anaerolineae bacterium]
MKNNHITEADVLAALGQVMDPELGRDLVSLGMIQDLVVQDSRVSFTIVLTTPTCPLKAQIEAEARAVVLALPGVEEVTINFRADGLPSRRPLPGVRHVIAVASGKGGVGKTTVAVNLALALAESGARVGLLDADIYGPNVPLMMGVERRPLIEHEKLLPLMAYGIKVMSLGFLVPLESPVIWRGPLVMQMMEQLLYNVAWGELDYLVVDLPPGTGDAQLTLLQQAPVSGAIIVTTPQDIALADAVKGLNMFCQMGVPVLGLVENMSYFVCPHCGQRTGIFGHGGGRETSRRLRVPFLGEVPLDPSICLEGDVGRPILKARPDSPQAEAFRQIAQAVLTRVHRPPS